MFCLKERKANLHNLCYAMHQFIVYYSLLIQLQAHCTKRLWVTSKIINNSPAVPRWVLVSCYWECYDLGICIKMHTGPSPVLVIAAEDARRRDSASAWATAGICLALEDPRKNDVVVLCLPLLPPRHASIYMWICCRSNPCCAGERGEFSVYPTYMRWSRECSMKTLEILSRKENRLGSTLWKIAEFLSFHEIGKTIFFFWSNSFAGKLSRDAYEIN